MARRLCLLVFLAVVPAGCDEAPTPPTARSRGPRTDVGQGFDPATAGTLIGQVRWEGASPEVPPFRSIASPLTDQPPPPARDWANPNAPRIDPTTRGVVSAVVFLRGIDVQKGRPWDLPAPRVELRGQQFHITQGAHAGNIGFVRAGEAIDLISRDDAFHSVQARGSAYFARMLPARGDLRPCRLETPGVVELTSGCGYFWMRAYLLVAEHPYHAFCDGQGRFGMHQVPPGEYEVVAWHPDWRVARHERNPDNSRLQQVRFGPALEAMRRVRIEPGKLANLELVLGRR